jgi:hypothetical protein
VHLAHQELCELAAAARQACHIAWAADHAKDGDLLVLAGVDAVEVARERISRMRDRKFLVAIEAHRVAAAVPEAWSTGLVAGRTLTQDGT